MKTENRNVVAIDVAKEQLEVLIDSRPCRVPNNPGGLRRLMKRLHSQANPWVFCEASGGYERALVGMLHEHDISVTLLNPARVRAFAHSEGIKAKNDPIDTRMIERFAREKNLMPTPAAPHPDLTALMDRRRHLSEQLAREKTRLQNSPKLIHPSIKRMIKTLEGEMDKLHQAIRKQVQQKPAYEHAAGLIAQIKGVGEVTAWSVLAYLPEITQLSRNRVVALAGLAPFDQDSGSSHAPRQISGGRHKVRNALYMAVLAAAVHNPVISAYMRGLKARGKQYKQAAVAAMRKLLLHIQSILKENQIQLVS